MLTATLAAALIQSAAPATPDLSWIAGYWLDCSNGREVSETWSDPRGGLMAGHALTVARGRVSFEFSHIGPTPQGHAYVAQPGGAPPTVFVVAETGPTRAVFANPENDFPTRIVYERKGDALKSRIEGEIDGQVRSMEWEFHGGPAEHALPGLNWRMMTAADLDAVAAIAAVGFPDHFEGRDCFENRLTLNPAGCFVLAGEAGEPHGYLVAYPWTADAAPALNTLIAAIPDDASAMYLHDLAIAPTVRGGGWSRPIVERLARDARAAGWPALTLVAVNDAAPFWERHGFVVSDPPGMADRLAGYGADARYMIRRLTA